MNSSQNNNKETEKSLISLVLKITGAIGGFAALFLGFGYITLTCYLLSVDLYGVIELPLRYNKEALIRLVNETINFYSNADLYIRHWYMIFVIIVSLSIPFIQKLKKNQKLENGNKKKNQRKDNENTKHNSLIRYFVILCQIIVISVILATFFLNKIPFKKSGSTIEFDELVFFTLSVPILIALILYLFFNFKNIEFDLTKMHKTTSGVFFILFILLFISIPFGYGSSIYSTIIYAVDIPECDGVEAFRTSSVEGYDILFLLGQKDENEVFSYVTDWPPRLIFVNRNSIKSITVKYGANSTMNLRTLRLESLVPEPALETEILADLSPTEVEKWK